MQCVHRNIIEHTLEIDEKIAPKKQKLRKMYEEKVKAVKLKYKGFKTRK
jgi:hypothetical protein